MFGLNTLSLATAALALGLFTTAQTPKEGPPRTRPTSQPTKKEEERKRPFELMIGDVAPELHSDEWLAGDALQIEKGKVTLVDFWATWSAPSLVDFKRLSGLQKRFGEKGLRVVGVTREDERGNRLFNVKEVVKEYAADIEFPLAWDSKGVTHERYMSASGHRKLPLAYLIDQSGRIAFIGHPGSIDATLEQVIEGKFDLEAAAKKYADDIALSQRRQEIESRMGAAYQEGRLGDVVSALDDLIALGPNFRHFAVNKFQLLLKDIKDPESAYAWALETIETCLAGDAYSLNTMAYSIVARNDFTPKRFDVAMALALHANQVANGLDGQIWNTIGAVHFALEEYEEAVDAMEKAVEFAPRDLLKRTYTGTLAGYRKKLAETK